MGSSLLQQPSVLTLLSCDAGSSIPICPHTCCSSVPKGRRCCRNPSLAPFRPHAAVMRCREFHAHLPQLLRRGGVYSFFNGLAADNPFFYAVYLQLVPAELHALQGLTTQYIQLPIQMDEQVQSFYTCVCLDMSPHICLVTYVDTVK